MRLRRVVAVGMVAAVAGVLAWAGMANARGPSGTDPSVPAPLVREQGPDDQIPADLLKGLPNTALIPGSARLLTVTGASRTFSGLNERGEVCLLTVVSSDIGPVVGATCAPSERFASDGMWQVVTAGPRIAAAVMVPDGYAGEASLRGEVVPVHNNVVVVEATDVADVPRAVDFAGPAGRLGVEIGDLTRPTAEEPPLPGDRP